MKWKGLQTLKNHKWRYLAILGGFLLFVGPGAYLIKAVFWFQGSTAAADIHKICFRMPFDWIAAGRFATFDGRFLLIGFLVAVLGIAFILVFILRLVMSGRFFNGIIKPACPGEN